LVASLILIAMLSALFQLAYEAVLVNKLINHRDANLLNSNYRPVSVIICARNEAHNLRMNLTGILQQDHLAYEVIVVDDDSSDATQVVLEELSVIHTQLKSIKIKEEQKQFPGKKGALAIGIAAAKYELLLMTDADCSVSSDQWIKKMTRPLLFDSTDMVLGISPYIKTRGLINDLVRYETMLTALQYIGLALLKKPYMGVGRNIAYKKSLYQKAGGFEHLTKTLSGDDDLFVQKVQAFANIEVVTDEAAFTWSHSPKDFASWWKQKTRHYSTGSHYKPESSWPISLFLLAKMGLYISAVILMLNISLQILVALIFFHILHSIMVKPLAQKLKTYDILWKSLFLDLLFIVTLTTAGAKSLLNIKYTWK